MTTMVDTDTLGDLLDSWLLHLAAERKSPRTVTCYAYGVERYLHHCAEHDDEEPLSRASLDSFTAAMLNGQGLAPATAKLRQFSVRAFSAWLAAEGEIDRDELVGVKPPRLREQQVDGLDDDQLRALVNACKGKRFTDRRDAAIVRLLADTGMRSGELLGMRVDDVDVRGGTAVVTGKGDRRRTVTFTVTTAQAVDRYVRARRREPRAGTTTLWLGARGQGFGPEALRKALRGRAKDAGIDHLHPHQLRHTYASRWLAAGGSEQGLMQQAGWRSRAMVDRYTRHDAARRAGEEARRLALGDDL